MRFSLKALAVAAALLWGGGVLFVGLVNLAVPSIRDHVPPMCELCLSRLSQLPHLHRRFGGYGLRAGRRGWGGSSVWLVVQPACRALRRMTTEPQATENPQVGA